MRARGTVERRKRAWGRSGSDASQPKDSGSLGDDQSGCGSRRGQGSRAAMTVAVRAIRWAVIVAVPAVVALVERDALAGSDEVDRGMQHASQVEGDDQQNGASDERQRPHPLRIPPMHPVEKTTWVPKPYALT